MSDKDLSITEESSLPLALRDDSVLTAVIKAEARIAAFVKIKQLSLRATTHHDWVNLGGKPYLQDTGAEKIAGLFSPTISKPIIARENFLDGHYMYTCDGDAFWGGKSIPVMGSRSSKDKFFIQYDYVEENGKRKRVDLSTEVLLERIDPGDVRKSALTNYRNNAIKDILGLEGITWSDLETAGIKKDDVVGVEYNNQQMSGDASDKAKDTEKMLVEMYGKDYATQLARITENRDKDGKLWPGIKKLDGCSEKKLPIVHRQVKKEYETWKKKSDKQEPAQTTSSKSSTLLGTSSKEYQNAKDAMSTADKETRIDEILASTDGIFSDGAIKGLTAFAKSQKDKLANRPSDQE